MRLRLLLAAALLLAGAGCVRTKIASFEECAAAGNPIMESYPRQCRADGRTFVEEVAVPPEAPPARPPEAATLRKGEIETFADGMTVTLTAIEDSRCPKDIRCVWAGELAAVFSVRASATALEAVDLRLGQTTRPQAAALGAEVTLAAITEETATISVRRP